MDSSWTGKAIAVGYLAEHPLVALMVVIAVGFLVGRVRIGTFSLGVSAVLFVGLAASTIEPAIELPSIVYEFGLVVFVYTIGLAAGPGFLATLRSDGLRQNALTAAVLLVAAVETVLVVVFTGLHAAEGAGMFAGALTNTPALAAVMDAIPRAFPDGEVNGALALPVVGYSLAYPGSVLGVIAVMGLLGRVWKIDHDQEARDAGVLAEELETWTLMLDPRYRDGVSIHRILATLDDTVVVSRLITRDGVAEVAGDDDVVHAGDRVVVVGTVPHLREAQRALGVREETVLDRSDRAELDYRRIFVSKPSVVGRRLRDLRLWEDYGARITRIRRGDIDMVADGDSVLQLGDRVRLVAPAGRMRAATDAIGDSYRELSEVDVLSFAVGITLGLLLGAIPLPIPGGGELRLGAAGGPLLVALVLGAIGRTGRLVWQLPYSANLTLRQIGVVLFLAGIGTTAGRGFGEALTDPTSLIIIGIGAVVTMTVSLLVMVVGHKVLKLPFGQTAGILASVQTQPAALAFASEQAGNDLPNRGYTAVYPLAMILKIVLAQALLLGLIALG